MPVLLPMGINAGSFKAAPVPIVAVVSRVVAGMEVVGVAEMKVVGVKVVGDGGAEVGVEMRLGVEIFVM